MLACLCAISLLTAPAVTFEDRTAALGLNLGGEAACWVDVDNDGWVDLISSGTVWRNVQGKRFVKFADANNVVAADYDNDGYVDLFSWSSMTLYHNHQGKGFDVVPLPKLPPTVSRGACWGDFNGDGFVDLYIGGYEDWDKDITYPNMILMNEGGKGFRLAWTESKYRSRGVTACDFNQDGALDVYVSNYRLMPNVLRFNDGKGNFRDAAAEYNVVATSPGFDGGHSIGAAWGDFDNDGAIDLFAGNFAHVDTRGDQPKSRFLRNLGPKAGFKFEDKGTCGVFYQESYASPAVGDFDNDGNLDLFFTTVYATASFGKLNFPVLFRNEGGFKFTDVTESAHVAKIGATYQAAWADFNHDGQLDFVSGGHLFVNQGSTGHWLEVRLHGDGKLVNRSAIGAQVRIRVGKKTFTRQIEAGTGEGNQNDPCLHFGLGEVKGRVDLEILWPGKRAQKVRRVAVDQLIDVDFNGQK